MERVTPRTKKQKQRTKNVAWLHMAGVVSSMSPEHTAVQSVMKQCHKHCDSCQTIHCSLLAGAAFICAYTVLPKNVTQQALLRHFLIYRLYTSSTTYFSEAAHTQQFLGLCKHMQPCHVLANLVFAT